MVDENEVGVLDGVEENLRNGGKATKQTNKENIKLGMIKNGNIKEKRLVERKKIIYKNTKGFIIEEKRNSYKYKLRKKRRFKKRFVEDKGVTSS